MIPPVQFVTPLYSFLEIVSTLYEDLQDAIIGIAYPIRKKDETKDHVENKEDLIESLRKLILGKFEDDHNQFYEWSRTIHNEVKVV